MSADSPFVVAGESLVDIVVPADGGERHDAVGGSCLNVAVGLSRLEVPTLLMTRVGDDERGRMILDHVAASGVRLADGSVVPGEATSTATAYLDTESAATYDFDLTWDLARAVLPEDATGLHVGSLGTTLEPGREAVLDLVRQAGRAEMFVSYDPNIRPAFLTDPAEAWAGVREVASGSRVVKLSDEDLRLLRGEDDEESVCRDLLAAELTELVVLTRGSQGARAFTEDSSITVPAPTTAVVDTVGAGDSFMAALLSLLCEWGVLSRGTGSLRALDEQRIELLVVGAATAAAVTCSRRGADPPARRELPATWPVR